MPEGQPDKVLVKHRGTDKSEQGENLNSVMHKLIEGLSAHYGWKIIYKDNIPQDFVDG